MNDETLLFGLAAVLAGIATVEFVLGFVYSPALFAIAVPFAAAAYLVWYQASGRLRERVEEGRAGSYRWRGERRREAERRRDSETGGFGAGPRESYSGRRGGFDADGRGGRQGGFGGRGAASAGRSRAGQTGAGRQTNGRTRVQQNAGPTPSEAYRRLGLDAGADFEEVRSAYREKVKSVHPDREGGDEEAFKRVTEAYEVLRERR